MSKLRRRRLLVDFHRSAGCLGMAFAESLRRFPISWEDLMMMAEQGSRRPWEAMHIRIERDHEMEYWTGCFGVSRDELKEALERVGPAFKDVESHFAR